MDKELQERIDGAFQNYKEVEIPEIGLTAYTKPFTIAELASIESKAQGKHLDTLIYTWITKLVDSKGEPIFSVKDKPTLRNKIASDVIARVATEINDSKGYEEARKNS